MTWEDTLRKDFTLKLPWAMRVANFFRKGED